ncbi:MAG: hypothetical protein A2514_11390 [Gammaproteobacteria bacterium RIFOXYD12_FULL_61_37]|nr:MAG: hypothetical protein A2514_11390 [Gammaproteobacteria bacterium RIFOXYD12_FULL_61_37]
MSKKKHVADFPPDVIAAAFRESTQKAARDAVEAGRVVTGMEGGRIVRYGPGHQPLPVPTGEVDDAQAA